MEPIIIILSVLVLLLAYKVRMLRKYLAVFSFSEKTINRLLVKKELIKISDIETVINESIGDMREDVGNKLIKYAKSIGITIPKYMGEEDLKRYIEEQELKRRDDEISLTDRMLMEDMDAEDLKSYIEKQGPKRANEKMSLTASMGLQ